MKPGARIKGFHISQPMMPANVPAAFTEPERQERARKRWRRILEKQQEYGESRFLNECIGVSTSTGVRLLTQEILQSLCQDYEMTRLPLPNSLQGVTRTIAGVDWSGGGTEVKGKGKSEEGIVKSRTVLHIWGDMGDGRLKTIFY